MQTPSEASNLHALKVVYLQLSGMCILAQEHAIQAFFTRVLRYYRCINRVYVFTPYTHKASNYTMLQYCSHKNCSSLALYTASYMACHEHGKC